MQCLQEKLDARYEVNEEMKHALVIPSIPSPAANLSLGALKLGPHALALIKTLISYPQPFQTL